MEINLQNTQEPIEITTQNGAQEWAENAIRKYYFAVMYADAEYSLCKVGHRLYALWFPPKRANEIKYESQPIKKNLIVWFFFYRSYIFM